MVAKHMYAGESASARKHFQVTSWQDAILRARNGNVNLWFPRNPSLLFGV
jgi:hypothetical protein